MKMRLTWLLILMLALTAFWGCSDDDDPVTPPADTAFEVMAAAGAAYVNGGTCPGVMLSSVLNTLNTETPDEVSIIDIRSAELYDASHIPGAFNSSLGELIADLDSGDIPARTNYVIVCKSGQTAGHAKIAMEMLGYTGVSTLKFGMSAWNSTLDVWGGNCHDALGEDVDIVNNNDGLTVHDLPTLTEGAGTVVADRVATMLTNGFKRISYAEYQLLVEADEDMFVLNYFEEENYMPGGPNGTPGHIDGAFQFTPAASLGIDQMLNNLPSDGTLIVVYCWTGQTSSQITAYLNMLGYNAKSLLYGSNNLFHGSLTGHKWDTEAVYSYELEMPVKMAAGF